MADQTYPYTATLELGDTVLQGCGGDPRDLLTAEEVWTVTEIAGEPIVPGTEVTMSFADSGAVAGSGGCNRFTALYELTGEGLSLGPAAATRMACPDDIMAKEQVFFAVFDVAHGGVLRSARRDRRSWRAGRSDPCMAPAILPVHLLAGIVEIVALGLAFDGGADRVLQHRVVAGGAERRAQVGHVLLPEAHEKLPGAGQAHAVAAFAEIMRQRRDEADLLPGLLQLRT
jgi:heat shock protein HslJ